MKKRSIIVLIVAIILILIIGIGIMYMVDMYRMKNNKSIIFSTLGYSYSSPEKLNEEGINKAIEEYILNKAEADSLKYHNEKWFVAIKNYLIDESDANNVLVYSWILEESYYENEDEIVQENGSSIPYKFVLKSNDSNYEVVSHQIPRDGSYYTEDMKIIFPDEVLSDMDKVHSDGTIEELKLNIQTQVTRYFKNEIETINNYSFVGTVLEEDTTYMLVKPNEDEEESKFAEKIKINYGEDHLDYLYGIGRKVVINYTGQIMKSYPAQINTNDILADGYVEFELSVEKSNKIEKKKILNNKDIYENNSDYNLYYYGLNQVNVTVDNKTITLEEALKSGKVSLTQLIVNANRDLDDKKITGSMYKDGSSMIYQYDTYTIIKLHTLDGNRDVWIGIPEMGINDIK